MRTRDDDASPPLRASERSVAATLSRGASKAGAMEITRAATNAIAPTIATARQSAMSEFSTPSRTIMACSDDQTPSAIASPARHPSPARSVPSTMNCDASRRRLTPSDNRTAISRRRATARASRRFKTFAQAMSSTISATPSTQSSVRDSSPADGPAAVRTLPAIATGRATLTGNTVGTVARWRSRLAMKACVRSVCRPRDAHAGFATHDQAGPIPVVLARERLCVALVDSVCDGRDRSEHRGRLRARRRR